MKPKDWLRVFALLAAGIGVYRLVRPRCPWCAEALDTISVAEAVACPNCRAAVTAAQAVLGREIWRALFV